MNETVTKKSINSKISSFSYGEETLDFLEKGNHNDYNNDLKNILSKKRKVSAKKEISKIYIKRDKKKDNDYNNNNINLRKKYEGLKKEIDVWKKK